MDADFPYSNLSTFDADEARELLRVIHEHVLSNGLQLGMCIVIVERDGVKTIGNMSPSQQMETFEMLRERLAGGGPDSATDITDTIAGDPTRKH